MATPMFDTDDAVQKLIAGQHNEEQARAIVHMVLNAHAGLLTRDYLDQKLAPIYTELAVLKESVTSIKWGIGFLFAGILALVAGMASLIVKTYFP